MLKTVDTTDNEMMEIYSENRENNKILDEIEQYVIRKFLVVINLNNLTFCFRYGTRSRSKGTLDLKTCHKFKMTSSQTDCTSLPYLMLYQLINSICYISEIM